MTRLAQLPTWPVGLSARLDRLEAGTPGAWYCRQWSDGKLDLWAYGERCWLLTRVEVISPGDSELVVVAAASSPHAGDALAGPCLAALEDLAREQGHRSLRFHTLRPGLVAIACDRGWHVAEHVLRRAVR